MHLTTDDLGAAHRVSSKVERKGWPPMIVRFRKREDKEFVMKNKGRNDIRFKLDKVVIHDDLSRANTGLMNRAKSHPDIKSAWSYKGQIYALTETNYRIKLELLCDLNTKIRNAAKFGQYMQPKFGPFLPQQERPAPRETDLTLHNMD